MKKTSYIKCNLYCIDDNFRVPSDGDIKQTVINSKKKFLRTIIVNNSSSRMQEILTGIEFDYSDIKICDRYSKIFRRNVIRQRIRRSSEPIHISLYHEDLTDCCIRDINYEFCSVSDVREYYHNITIEFGTIDNYKKYLLNLKENAYNTLKAATKKHEKCKRIKLTRII